RKEANFEMNDRIQLFYEGSERIKKAFIEHAEYISSETLSVNISNTISEQAYIKTIRLGDESLKIGVKKN
ncbi:MAG: DUF5915 domain-containing protein, partial [bacterium]|nr:DUF5915 domain-containing protein [bacterium]